MPTAKENILSRIRQSKASNNLWKGIKESNNKAVFKESNLSLLETFRASFEAIDGKLFVINSEQEETTIMQSIFSSPTIFCIDTNLQKFLEKHSIAFKSDFNSDSKVDYGFISCEYLTARLGSVITSSALASGRRMNVFPEHQIVFADISQLVKDTENALQGIRQKYKVLPSMISLATGPSRTADIEKTLILGAHGPKSLTVILKNY